MTLPLQYPLHALQINRSNKHASKLLIDDGRGLDTHLQGSLCSVHLQCVQLCLKMSYVVLAASFCCSYSLLCLQLTPAASHSCGPTSHPPTHTALRRRCRQAPGCGGGGQGQPQQGAPAADVCKGGR